MGNMLDPSRIELKWTAGQQGKVGADATAAMLEDRHFEISGTSAIDANVTYDADHGLLLTCQGGAADQVVVMPSTAGDDRSLFREISWSPENEVEFEAVIRTGALSNTVIYAAGLVLTFPATFSEGNDNDRIVFNYLQGTDTKWQIAVNVGGTDVTIDTRVVVVTTEVVHFAIRFDSMRRAHCFINEDKVYVSSPMTAGTALLPVVAIETGGAAANDMHLRAIAMARKPLP